MNHINEGDFILQHIGASESARLGFMLHPLIQRDADLYENQSIMNDELVNSRALVLAFEYRNIANQYLSQREIVGVNEIRLSPLLDVNDMLKADKIQNYKDFILFHKETHPRSEKLDTYFKNWLIKLEIDNFDEWFSLLRQRFSEN